MKYFALSLFMFNFSFAQDFDLSWVGTTHDFYISKGPSWRDQLIKLAEKYEESITKEAEEGDFEYDAIVNCLDDTPYSTEGFEVDSFKVKYDFYALKNNDEVKDAKKKSRRADTIAYGLKPIVLLTYSADDILERVCEAEVSTEYLVFLNNKNNPQFLGSINQD